MRQLQEIHADISAIDAQIEALHKKRVQLNEEIAACRLTLGKKIFHFTPVEAFDFQNARVVFQGVEGAYSQQALQQFFGAGAKNYHVETWRDAMEAIAGGEADYAVLPIENSSAGIVSENFDLLEEYDHCIIGEQIIKIDHCLIALKGASLSDITDVYSHPQALMQCSRYLEEHGGWEKHSLKNTAGSAKKVRDDGKKNKAAIAARITADIYDLSVLAEGIQDNRSNSTKFIIVTGKKEFRRDAQKISVCFEIPDDNESGSLYRTLSHLIYNNLNMIKIESRPMRDKTWEYRFFIDIEGNLTDGAVQSALSGLEGATVNLRVLGNY